MSRSRVWSRHRFSRAVSFLGELAIIQIKRIYVSVGKSDGVSLLFEWLWPEG